MTDLVQFLIFWVQRHPYPVIALGVAFLLAGWLLNRKSALAKDADRVVRNLVETSKDKYKDVRPLR